MMRGARVTVPPLHSLADVLALCFLLLVLVLIVRWIFGSSPLQDLAKVLSPPAMATLLEIEIRLAGVSTEISALLPVREKASRSAALELAQLIGAVLLSERDKWRFGALRAARVKETAGLEGWEIAWQHASGQEGPSNNELAPSTMMVTIIALVTGRSIRLPKQVTADEIARFVRGLGALDVRYLDAFGALASPGVASADSARELGLVAL